MKREKKKTYLVGLRHTVRIQGEQNHDRKGENRRRKEKNISWEEKADHMINQHKEWIKSPAIRFGLEWLRLCKIATVMDGKKERTSLIKTDVCRTKTMLPKKENRDFTYPGGFSPLAVVTCLSSHILSALPPECFLMVTVSPLL